MIEDELTVSVDDVPAEQDPYLIIRRPDVLFTNGYLDNPITFKPDPRYFYPLDINVVDYLLKPYARDIAQYIIVEIGNTEDTEQYYTISLRTPTYSRELFNNIFDTTFTELS